MLHDSGRLILFCKPKTVVLRFYNYAGFVFVFAFSVFQFHVHSCFLRKCIHYSWDGPYSANERTYTFGKQGTLIDDEDVNFSVRRTMST